MGEDRCALVYDLRCNCCGTLVGQKFLKYSGGIMGNPIQAGEDVIGGLEAIHDVNNAKTAHELVVGLEQALAFLVSTSTNPAYAGAVVATNAMAATGTIGKMLVDYQNRGRIDYGDLAALAGNVLLIAAAVGSTINPLSRGAWVATQVVRGVGWLGAASYLIGDAVAAETNTSFNSARAVVLQRDPLVLDLDGDGLELSAASGNVLVDHNADGIKTGTGWARPDDGFLVRDLNGNGSIDSGRELFGVDTVKSNGQLASQGFDALADLDSNGDGQITSADAAWGQLQVWRDANQDGISQAGELSGLDALGITRLGLNGSATGPQAGQTINNNRVALSTTFTRNGVNRTMGAIDLEANGFFSEIPPQVVDEAGNPVTWLWLLTLWRCREILREHFADKRPFGIHYSWRCV
ncbi:hypothetical protein ACWKW4_01750 [Hydrogenophaga borbori]